MAIPGFRLVLIHQCHLFFQEDTYVLVLYLLRLTFSALGMIPEDIKFGMVCFRVIPCLIPRVLEPSKDTLESIWGCIARGQNIVRLLFLLVCWVFSLNGIAVFCRGTFGIGFPPNSVDTLHPVFLDLNQRKRQVLFWLAFRDEPIWGKSKPTR